MKYVDASTCTLIKLCGTTNSLTQGYNCLLVFPMSDVGLISWYQYHTIQNDYAKTELFSFVLFKMADVFLKCTWSTFWAFIGFLFRRSILTTLSKWMPISNLNTIFTPFYTMLTNGYLSSMNSYSWFACNHYLVETTGFYVFCSFNLINDNCFMIRWGDLINLLYEKRRELEAASRDRDWHVTEVGENYAVLFVRSK